eukprot:scaffold13455_cov57-Phaeocystis_antarctica.AAC.4
MRRAGGSGRHHRFEAGAFRAGGGGQGSERLQLRLSRVQRRLQLGRLRLQRCLQLPPCRRAAQLSSRRFGRLGRQAAQLDRRLCRLLCRLCRLCRLGRSGNRSSRLAARHADLPLAGGGAAAARAAAVIVQLGLQLCAPVLRVEHRCLVGLRGVLLAASPRLFPGEGLLGGQPPLLPLLPCSPRG